MSDRTLIQVHSSALIKGMYETALSIKGLDHKLLKGEIRELFVSEILEQFLTDQFAIGSGIIVNQAGMQSPQCDVIVYDKTVLPPFIKKHNLGVFPIECVLAIIEVKSNLTKQAILKAEENFGFIRNEIGNSKYSIYTNEYLPFCAIIGFYGLGAKELRVSSGEDWLNRNISHLFSICLIQGFCWLKLNHWRYSKSDPDTFEETKRFIAALLDYIRTKSDRDPYHSTEDHKAWLSIYIRDQDYIRKHFGNQ